ncbi:hypothetical protein HT747_16145 [Brevibacillus borstelensis]|uniref:lipoprotein n=1 Tax=Brevibacillus borstelensis TaxID=45462 RepID=UPI00156250FD|nr:lipoprotein [Brevibacillus borstelensis]MBE5396668.1 hypothetical protein [Brevibacillus borstelensis]
MKRTLYTFAILALLSGCSDTQPETPASAPPPTKPAEQPAAPAESASTEPAPKPTALFDILGIASKSEADVEAALGQPIETEAGEWTLLPSEEKTPFTRHVYEHKAGAVAIMFIEGKAARISFEPKGDLRYPDDAVKAMSLVGLAAGDRDAPDFEAPHYVRYEGVSNFFYVDVISGLPDSPERIREVKVVTDEKYK